MRQILLLILGVFFITRVDAITVVGQNGLITANFTANCAPVNVNFTSTFVPGTVNYVWYFGDGSPSSTLASPSHTFQYAGLYTVQVAYYDASFNLLAEDYMYIDMNGEPQSIQAYTTTACANDRLSFWVPNGANSNPQIGYSYTWNFGDGNVETSPYPSPDHIYSSAGIYTLSVTCNTPCGTFVKNLTVTIGTNVPMTSGYFSIYPQEICPGDQVYVNYGGSTTQFITFGDGTFTTNAYTKSYSQPGTYPVTATLTNGCGNTFTYFDTVRVRTDIGFGPNSGISVYNSSPACIGMEVYFSGPSNYSNVVWNYPDGTSGFGPWDSQMVNGAFSTTPVSVHITNGCGRDTTIYTTVQIVTTIPVTEIDLTVPASVCTGSELGFSANGDNEQEQGFTYAWNFGDGTTSTQFGGTHVYSASGTYNVSLTVTNGCGNTATQTTTVTAGTNIAPDPNTGLFAAPDDGACVGDSVLVVVYPGLNGTYSWDFGDGSNETGYSLITVFGRQYAYKKHRYAATGSYDLSMTYTNSCGLSVTRTFTYNIGSNIEASANVLFDETQQICLGEPIPFSALGGSQYAWDFGDNTGVLVTNSTFVPIYHTYDNPGSYNVTLVVTNGCGNTETETFNVFVPDNRINISTSTTYSQCGQDNGIAIAVIDGGFPPYDIRWSNGETTVVADSLSSGIYVVNVEDSKGCYNFALASVNDAQAPNVVVNNVGNVTCYGNNDGFIDINVIGSTAPYSYQWSNGATTQDIGGLEAGPYEVIVTDANGCRAVRSITVSEPGQVTVSFVKEQASCGLNNGHIQAIASGTTGPFTYIWSSGQSGPGLYNVGLGIYTVNVIDAAGCITTKSVAMSEASSVQGPTFGGPAILVAGVSPLNCNGGGANIDIEVVQSSGNLSYNWNTGASTQDVTVTQVGQYNVLVTDLTTGCKAIEIFTITHAAPDGQNICMVTVDSIYSYNKVVWEKEISTEISHYNVYRESSQNGLYFHIGTVPYDSLSVFDDYVANPMITSWRYKLAAVDFCGVESDRSDFHKTIHVTQNLGLGGTINLIWDHYRGFGYSTYNVIRYTNSNGWETIATVSSANTSYTDPTPPSDPGLFYIIEAVPSSPCVSTRAINNNTTRSNRTQNPVAPPASVGEMIGAIEGIAVYPNPNDGNFTLQADFVQAEDAAVEIWSLDGKVIRSFDVQGVTGRYTTSIQMQEVPQGIYILRMSSASSSFVRKVVVY